MSMKFNNGDRLRDLVTGFEGVVIARSEYLNGCRQYCLKPRLDKDGKLVAGEWFDEPQLELIEQGAVAISAPEKTEGGPQACARRL